MENVELVYRFIDAFNRRDYESAELLIDDDIEVVPRVGAMEGSYRGREGSRRFWESLLDVWPDLTVQAVEPRDYGDLTVTELHCRGRGAGSDLPWEWTLWQALRWRRAKCVWWGHFGTREEALEAVGLPEQEAHPDS